MIAIRNQRIILPEVDVRYQLKTDMTSSIRNGPNSWRGRRSISDLVSNIGATLITPDIADRLPEVEFGQVRVL